MKHCPKTLLEELSSLSFFGKGGFIHLIHNNQGDAYAG